MMPDQVFSSSEASDVPEGLGVHQRLPDTHVLANVRHEMLDHLDLVG